MNEIFDKIYYVNLDEDTNKNKFFLDQISKTSLKDKCLRFSAINGKEIDIDQIDNTIITKHARSSVTKKKQKIFGISLTYGSLGCALSHKAIWEQCAKGNNPYLIFEDDATPHKDFDKIFSSIVDRISSVKYDLFYIGYNQIPGFKKTKIDNVISKPSGLITGTYGYMASPAGANKLLSIFPIDKQIDSSISDNLAKFNVYCSTTQIIHASSSFGSKTQRDKSCINNIQKLNPSDDWNKLFL
jgi:GR25 family glycosyltransferase involved in LPS biosynthesis